MGSCPHIGLYPKGYVQRRAEIHRLPAPDTGRYLNDLTPMAYLFATSESSSQCVKLTRLHNCTGDQIRRSVGRNSTPGRTASGTTSISPQTCIQLHVRGTQLGYYASKGHGNWKGLLETRGGRQVTRLVCLVCSLCPACRGYIAGR